MKNENQLGKVHIPIGDGLELDQFRLPRPDELLGGGEHLVTAAGLGVVEGGHGAAVVLDQLGHLGMRLVRYYLRSIKDLCTCRPSAPELSSIVVNRKSRISTALSTALGFTMNCCSLQISDASSWKGGRPGAK